MHPQTLALSLQKAFPTFEFIPNHILSTETYFKIGGPAEVFIRVSQKEDLKNLCMFCTKNKIKMTVLGGGSNILVSDQGISGLVIKNETRGLEIDEKSGIVRVDSGVLVNLLVRKTLDLGLEGLEYFMGLPGTVGGAVYNNAHFVKELFGEHVKDVSIVDEEGAVKTLQHAQLDFAYDYSIFHVKKLYLLDATLQLGHGKKIVLEEKAMAAVKKRSSSQPIGMPSSGCIFQNVKKTDGTTISAGMLIDSAGLKGEKVGGAEVSSVHANFIVNTGNATAQDVLSLIQIIKNKVEKKHGFTLQEEVFMLS